MCAKVAYKTDAERKRHNLNLRLNDEELEKLEILCESYGLTKSGMLMYLLKSEFRRFRELNGAEV